MPDNSDDEEEPTDAEEQTETDDSESDDNDRDSDNHENFDRDEDIADDDNDNSDSGDLEVTFFVQQNLEEHAGHGGDDIFTTDSTCNLIKVLSLFLKGLFYYLAIGEGGRVTIFSTWVRGGSGNLKPQWGRAITSWPTFL